MLCRPIRAWVACVRIAMYCKLTVRSRMQAGGAMVTGLAPWAKELGQNSFVCQRCGGVVSQARREAHERLWCPSLQQQ